MNICLELIKTFLLIGAFSFGGGMANMELMRSRVVGFYGWMTTSEFTDIVSISEMTPGPLGINLASFTGTRLAGIPGTLCATVAYVTPALFIVIILAKVYYKYRSIDIVQKILNGLRPAVAAMVLAAAVKLIVNAWWGGSENISAAGTNPVALALTFVFLIILQKKKLGPVQSIFLSGVMGAVIYAATGF